MRKPVLNKKVSSSTAFSRFVAEARKALGKLLQKTGDKLNTPNAVSTTGSFTTPGTAFKAQGFATATPASLKGPSTNAGRVFAGRQGPSLNDPQLAASPVQIVENSPAARQSAQQR